jgi:hypothetical protein
MLKILFAFSGLTMMAATLVVAERITSPQAAAGLGSAAIAAAIPSLYVEEDETE